MIEPMDIDALIDRAWDSMCDRAYAETGNRWEGSPSRDARLMFHLFDSIVRHRIWEAFERAGVSRGRVRRPPKGGSQ